MEAGGEGEGAQISPYKAFIQALSRAYLGSLPPPLPASMSIVFGFALNVWQC